MKKYIIKGFGIALLIAAVLIATIPAGALNAAVVDEFQFDHDSLDKYEGTAFKVSVPNNVTRIGEEAFAGNQSIAQVDTGLNTKSIEHGAFSNCPYLYSITTHDALKKIDTAAFAGDNKLTSVYLGGGVEEMGYGVFAGCNNLSTINISRNNEDFTVLGGGLYDNKGEMLYAYLGGYDATYYRMPNSVKHMSKYAFWGNEKLDSVSLSSYLTAVPAYAFSNCRNLKAVNIPYSVQFIEAKAFENCIGLVDVVIPPSVTYIDPTAFDGCTRLNIIADPGTAAYEFFRNFDNSDIANTENGDTKPVIVPNLPDSSSVSNGTGNNAGNGNATGSDANTTPGMSDPNGSSGATSRGGSSDTNTDSTNSSNNGNNANTDNNGNTGNNGGSDNNGGTQNVPAGDGHDYQESPLTIASAATGYRDASKDPSNVDYMPTVDPLSLIDGPDVVAKTIVVGGRAVLFLDPNVTVHQGVVTDTRTDGATDGSSSEADRAAEDNNPIIYDSGKGGYLPKFTEVGNKIAMQAYYANRKMDDYQIPEHITDIGDFAFARSNVPSVSIPEGVTHIGYGAFYHCDDLSNVSIPSTVTDIDGYAFANTPYINNFKSDVSGGDFLIVGDGVLLAYGGTDSVINIPEGVKKIAPGTFMDNKKITSVNLPATLSEVGEDAFRGCTSLSSVMGGANVTTIGDRAYMGCPLSALTIPGSVTKMGLRCVDFSDSVKSNNTKVVVFAGSELPKVGSDNTSARLENDAYRQDALYGVLYAVVPNAVNEFDGTVLDDDALGFSGLILSKELDASGNETGNMIVRDNYIFSEDVLSSLPEAVTIQGTTYKISDFDKIKLAETPSYPAEGNAVVRTVYNGNPIDGYMAKFSETENVGTLNIASDSDVASEVKALYTELFGSDNTPEIAGYDITLKDVTETVPIKKFGKAELSITMPIPEGVKGNTYHVVCVDDDGQLEEVATTVDEESKALTFTTNHLSHFGIYATDGDTGRSILRNGQTVRNYKLDDSPNTGDNSMNIRYVIAFMVACVGLFMVVYKRRVVTA
ncbi:MAG: leucine-rich repeat domain-containing protein [Lachnospiraceae bacterium]|nr:leucine-rich repeat domain-containing protein [Lachnospiraceae bacterium]